LTAAFPSSDTGSAGFEKMKDTYATKSSRRSKYFILLPLLPVLINFLHNANLFNEFIFVRPVLWLYLIHAAFALSLYLLFKKILKYSTRQAAVLASLIMLFFNLGGSIQGFMIQQKTFSVLGKWIVLFGMGILLLGGLAVYYKKRNPPVKNVSLYLASLLSIIILYEGVKFARTVYQGRTLFAVIGKMTKPVLDNRRIQVTEKPDIHYIIFDSYTNYPTLDTLWNYKNPIYKYLSDRGFYTVDSATSNYNFTPFSLGSILNLQYLTTANYYLERTFDNFNIGLGLYENNQLFRFFRDQLYELSVFSLLEDTREVAGLGNFAPDELVTWLRKQTLEKFYLDPWIAHKIKQVFGGKKGLPDPVINSLRFYADYNRRALQHIHSVCEKVSSEGSPPLFSLTHFIVPHSPYVFDENGKPSFATTSPETGMQDYLTQVKYANTIIKDITSCLLKDSSRKQVIILHGDHGFREFRHSYQKEEYGAFSAFYFFNKDYSSLRKDMSHVNTYRLVLNRFFNDSLPLLKDSIVLWSKDRTITKE
jgi:hypothetical protein